jgi:hypothetical protein
MDDDHIVWSHQEFKGDSFMVGCGPKTPAGGNCPETLGPDWDFGGASTILQTMPNGRDVLVAAGKGGIAIALDPDNRGAVLWRTTLYEGQPPSALGLVLFGGTADGTRAYFPLQQPGAGSPLYGSTRIANGRVIWSFDTNAEFKTRERHGLRRLGLYRRAAGYRRKYPAGVWSVTHVRLKPDTTSCSRKRTSCDQGFASSRPMRIVATTRSAPSSLIAFPATGNRVDESMTKTAPCTKVPSASCESAGASTSTHS